jgi:hypothetical protein
MPVIRFLPPFIPRVGMRYSINAGGVKDSRFILSKCAVVVGVRELVVMVKLNRTWDSCHKYL